MDVHEFVAVVGPNEGAVVGAALRQLSLNSDFIPNFLKGLGLFFSLFAHVGSLNLLK